MTAKILLHEFQLRSEDDPALYAAAPLYEWEKSAAGQWAMKNSATTPVWELHQDHMTYMSVVRIYGELSEVDATVYRLKCTGK